MSRSEECSECGQRHERCAAHRSVGDPCRGIPKAGESLCSWHSKTANPDGKPVCDKCGQAHPLCSAHRNPRRGGGPCGGHPLPYQDVCRFHGGATRASEAKAERKHQTEVARREVALFGARKDIHPAEALLELVQWTAGEVDYWRYRVTKIEEDDLIWGVTKIKIGGEDAGETEEAKPHVAYQMLVDASNRLERYSASALKAGVEERRVRIAEQAGAQLASVVQAILDRLELNSAQRGLVATVVPEEMRKLAELAS